ncbi:hypothetical protein Sjap_003086 [Stephania japonica]|uniref:Uncharacterized protein n=1 Tax=Stephania japonica TaxID=461633 RepID=A0AAP0PWR1_9MAGN
MYQVVYLNKVSDLPALGSIIGRRTYEQGARPPQQGSQQESHQQSFEAQVVSYGGPCTANAMVEMVHTGVYRGDNGFKPGYLTHLEEALKTSCPASKIKARPHIDTSNMVVAEDDVWDDYLAKYPDAKQWRSKSFIHYEKCCIIFGNDRATGEDAFDAVDAVEELGGNNESNSENGSDPIVPEDVEFTQETSRSQSVTPEVTTNPNKRKKRTSDGGVADMITAAQILGPNSRRLAMTLVRH